MLPWIYQIEVKFRENDEVEVLIIRRCKLYLVSTSYLDMIFGKTD